MRRALFLTAALSIGAAWPAGAQNLKLDFQDGRVSVEATGVPVRTILTEWGKIGGTKVVGADKITGAPLTIKLINVTEKDALETILRSVAGYMAAPRSTGQGSSMYDRILVMATSTAPVVAANPRPNTPQPNNALGGTQRFVPPQRTRPDEQPEAPEADEPDENPPNPPVFTFPQPGQVPNAAAPQFQNAPVNTGQPGVAVNPANGPQPNVTINPAPAPAGPVGSPRPGMIVNPPQPNTPQPPGTMIRPPGRGGN